MKQPVEPQAGAQAQARASAGRAKAAFRNFTLSQLGKKPAGRVYVDPKRDVIAQQAESISRQLPTLAPAGPGLRLVASQAAVPGMDSKGNIDLATLLAALDKARSGVQFHAAAAALGRKLAIQAQVDDFFAKLGASK